jgi:acyl-CoA dehydrogenase
VRTAGRAAAPVPLIETFLAEQMLAAADLPTVDGPLTIGPVMSADRLDLWRHNHGWVLSGKIRQIPWARHAVALVALAESEDGCRTVVVRNLPVAEHGANYAGEPRDGVSFSEKSISDEDVSLASRGWNPDRLQLAGALFRAVAMTGALETVLALTVRYAQERVQFGRPIGKFQAVQQQISVLASQVAAAVAAAQGAIDRAANDEAAFEIAAAKTRIGDAAGIASAIAHQVHGAMGFTHEHSLQLSTRRLWTWRDEFGSESEWAEWIGRAVTRVGGAGLWPYITSSTVQASETP